MYDAIILTHLLTKNYMCSTIIFQIRRIGGKKGLVDTEDTIAFNTYFII